MAIIQTLSFNQFARAFDEMGRSNQFSYEALQMIFDYLSDLDENIELDVIGICCDFMECYAEEAINSYGVEIDHEDYLDPDEAIAEVAQQLKSYTTVLGVTDEEAPTVVFVNY